MDDEQNLDQLRVKNDSKVNTEKAVMEDISLKINPINLET